MLSTKIKKTEWFFDKKTGLMDLSNKEEYQNLLEEVRALKSQVVKSYVGASLASLFIEHPEIESVTVTVESNGEYDDQGGTYTYYTAQISFEYNQEVDEDEFDQLAEEFKEEGDGYEYFTALEPISSDSYDVKGKLDRSDIEDLLLADTVSGLEVFKFIY